MKFKFLTFSFVLLFTTFSFGTTVLAAHEPHKETAAIFELLERENEKDDEDE